MSRIFVPGTRILVNNSSSPVGWTKIVLFDNCCLRGTSSNASFGGSLDFTSVFSNATISYATQQTAQTTISGSLAPTTLTSSQIPTHIHVNDSNTPTALSDALAGSVRIIKADVMLNSNTEINTPSGFSHTHTISSGANVISLSFNKNMAIKYVDLIIIERDSS